MDEEAKKLGVERVEWLCCESSCPPVWAAQKDSLGATGPMTSPAGTGTAIPPPSSCTINFGNFGTSLARSPIQGKQEVDAGSLLNIIFRKGSPIHQVLPLEATDLVQNGDSIPELDQILNFPGTEI